MKCCVNKCTNEDHQGNGFYLNVTEPSFGKVGHEWICSPCWNTIVGKNEYPQYTQIYRNMKDQWQTFCNCAIPINVHGLCLECSKNIEKER